MKNNFFLIFFCFATFIQAQDNDYPYPSLSPEGDISQFVGNTRIKLTYERPSVRDRKIFGGLVPWGKIWRTGAGKCTRISFDSPVTIEGQPIPAGTFSLFTIPTPDEWVVILNSDTTLSGSFGYDQKKDITRFSVPSQRIERHYEALTFDIDLAKNDAKMFMSWDNTQITFKIETTTDEEIHKFIETELLTGKSKASDSYAGAASYLFFQGEDYATGLQLADKALELNRENTWVYNTKIAIYEKLMLYDKVLTTIEQAIRDVKKRSYESEEARLVDVEAYERQYKAFQALVN